MRRKAYLGSQFEGTEFILSEKVKLNDCEVVHSYADLQQVSRAQ